MWVTVCGMTENKVPRALRLAQRMDRLGISARDLAGRASIDRASVTSARNGRARTATYGLLEAALDSLEDEYGMEPAATVSSIALPDGAIVTFEGDPGDVAVAAARFLAELDQASPRTPAQDRKEP